MPELNKINFMKFWIQISCIFFVIFINDSCVNSENSTRNLQQKEVIALLNGQELFSNEIDSIIGTKIYDLQLDALKLLISKKFWH